MVAGCDRFKFLDHEVPKESLWDDVLIWERGSVSSYIILTYVVKFLLYDKVM